jgi:hypothetical protein
MFRLTLLAIALAAASAGNFVDDHAEQIAKWQEFKTVSGHVKRMVHSRILDA